MNLQPLYDTKEQLEHAAIAGTNLLGDDFRLRRAAQDLEPLAAASPVFEKISSGVERLLAAPPEERGAQLLDVLALVDAVACTQATVGVEGELEPLPAASPTYLPLHHSELQPLLDDLTGTGGGRTKSLRLAYESHPERFGDFRVLPAVVAGLGNGSADVAELCMDILEDRDAEVLPLLERDFDPAGKKEMVRKVQLALLLGGEEGQRWIASVLPECKKDVREAAILALGASQDNAPLIRDLVRTERRKAKLAAIRALSAMEDAESRALLEDEVRACKPENLGDLLSQLGFSNGMNAGEVLAAALMAFLDGHPADKPLVAEDGRLLSAMIEAIGGKDSPGMVAFWRRTATLPEDPYPGKLPPNPDAFAMTVSRRLQFALFRSVVLNPSQVMLSLAEELGQSCPARYLEAAFAASMVTRPPEEVFDTYAPHIVRTGLFRRENPRQEAERLQLLYALSWLRWSPEKSAYEITRSYEPIHASIWLERRLITQGLDDRWLKLLTSPNTARDDKPLAQRHHRTNDRELLGFDATIAQLIRPDDPVCKEVLGPYFHQRALETGAGLAYEKALLECGWTEWDGFLSSCAARAKSVNRYEVDEILDALPISNAAKADELEAVNKLVTSGKVKPQWQWTADEVTAKVALLRGTPDADAR